MPERTPPARDPASRARMPLVELVTSDALDEEYAEVAARRATTGSAPRGRPGPLAAVVVLVFAVMVTTSFVQTRAAEDVTTAGRGALEERIVARRRVVAAAQEQIVALRADNAAADADLGVLTEADDAAERRLGGLRALSGFATAVGSGLRVVVDDAPGGRPAGRVFDEDLALLVNGLWQAGATAIAVNGQRLTALSAFRFSGVAIRLDKTSLSPPYTVLALGDTRTLAADLLETSTGLRFTARAEELGFRVSRQTEERLTLPPASPQRLADVRTARSGLAADQDDPDGRDQP